MPAAASTNRIVGKPILLLLLLFWNSKSKSKSHEICNHWDRTTVAQLSLKYHPSGIKRIIINKHNREISQIPLQQQFQQLSNWLPTHSTLAPISYCWKYIENKNKTRNLNNNISIWIPVTTPRSVEFDQCDTSTQFLSRIRIYFVACQIKK